MKCERCGKEIHGRICGLELCGDCWNIKQIKEGKMTKVFNCTRDQWHDIVLMLQSFASTQKLREKLESSRDSEKIKFPDLTVIVSDSG